LSAGFVEQIMPTVVHGRTRPVAVSIEQGAELSGTSPWWIKQKLRGRELDGLKAGRRTLVVFESLERLLARLPKAEFAPPVDRKAARETRKDEENVT
jgi:hypothetical protein